MREIKDLRMKYVEDRKHLSKMYSNSVYNIVEELGRPYWDVDVIHPITGNLGRLKIAKVDSDIFGVEIHFYAYLKSRRRLSKVSSDFIRAYDNEYVLAELSKYKIKEV